MRTRRSRSSLIAAFGVGFLWAGAGTLAAFGLHLYLAPPTDTNSSEHARTAIAELVPGIARWAQSAYATDGQKTPSTVTTATAPESAPAVDEAVLREAQVRVARQQADVQAQRVLVRSIQQELQRVGCYAGAVDGHWSDGTRSAMGAFNESLRVKLPLNAPDYILLTMLQGHSRPACGGDVSPAKSVVAATRPAQRDAVPTPRAAPKTAWTTSVTSAEQPATRPAVAGEVRITSTTNPVVTGPAPQFAAAPVTPLPGRMAMGAPAVPAAPAQPAPAMPLVDPQAGKPQAAGPSKAAPPVRQVSAPAPRRAENTGGGGGGNRGSQGSSGSSSSSGSSGSSRSGDWRSTAFRGN